MNKKRGCNAERELLHLLSKEGWAVARVAGSGMISETNCDLFAGNGKKKYVIEVKIASNHKKYFNREQIKSLVKFAKNFGLRPLIAIKFLRKGWFFIKPEYLKETNKGLVISFEKAKEKNMGIIK